MVDLVKIRKKAKKNADDAEQAAAVAPPSSEATPVEAPAPAVEAPPSEPVPVAPETSASIDEDVVPKPVETSKLERFKQEAGKRRTTNGSVAKSEEAHDQARLELLTFVIANEHYAVDIERIVEIVTPRPITRIPNADDTIVGIISLRGTIVTLVDVRRKLRHAAVKLDDAEARIVVVEREGETIGFTVDRVLRVVKPSAAEIEPHPVVHASELDDSVRGVFRVNDALTILLDLDKLVAARAQSS